MNLFKRNEAAVNIIEALKKDPQRVDEYRWERMYDRIYSEVTPRERRWMHKELTKIKTLHRVVQIAILELGGGEPEPQEIQMPVHGAGQTQQAYNQHLMNQQMNAIGLTPSHAQNIYGGYHNLGINP